MKASKMICPAVALASVLTVLCFVYSTAPMADSTQAAPAGSKPHLTHLPPTPDSLTFCGERVPLGNQATAEAYDREMIVNTFWHSNTILIIKKRQRFFSIIEPILAECGVPDDFKYLCAIESSLQTTAKSPAGAAGLWQILEATGREYGLIVNDEVDQRYDIRQSTYAACRYLRQAYARLGSWTLVAAAYNGGMARVTKNMDTQRQNSYYDLLWGEETGRYVFRILALKTILASPADFGFNIDSTAIYPPLRYHIERVDTSIANIAQWAIDRGTNYKSIKNLNPWLRKNTLTVSNKAFEIMVPDTD